MRRGNRRTELVVTRALGRAGTTHCGKHIIGGPPQRIGVLPHQAARAETILVAEVDADPDLRIFLYAKTASRAECALARWLPGLDLFHSRDRYCE
jgi:hypothetical protein